MLSNIHMYLSTHKYSETYTINLRDSYGSTSHTMYYHTPRHIGHMYWSNPKLQCPFHTGYLFQDTWGSISDAHARSNSKTYRRKNFETYRQTMKIPKINYNYSKCLKRNFRKYIEVQGCIEKFLYEKLDGKEKITRLTTCFPPPLPTAHHHPCREGQEAPNFVYKKGDIPHPLLTL